jgi:hypothetical protein
VANAPSQAQTGRYDELANAPFTEGFLSKDTITALKDEWIYQLLGLGTNSRTHSFTSPAIGTLPDQLTAFGNYGCTVTDNLLDLQH